MEHRQTKYTASIEGESWAIDIEKEVAQNEKAKGALNTISYMSYTAVKSTSTKQYKVLNHSTATNNGVFRMVDGRYCFAVGPGVRCSAEELKDSKNWSSGAMNGRYLDIVLSDGRVIPGIVGDSKSYSDNCIYQGNVYTSGQHPFVIHYTDACPTVIEAIVTSNKNAQDAGGSKYIRNTLLNGATIKQIIVYKRNIIDDGPLK